MAAIEHQLAPVCAKHLDLAWFCFPKVPSPAVPEMSTLKCSPLCHPACPGLPWDVPPEQTTCLRQVKGGMNMGKRCLQFRPRGPAPKNSPARKGWAHCQAVERRRCGTTLFVCSLGACSRASKSQC
jgi:hypothetical protein